MATLWDACFAAGMPGVVSATLTPARGAASTVYLQWWRELQLASDGEQRVSAVARMAKGTTADLGHLVRGDRVSIAGTEYQAVTDAEDDGHGVSTIYLEPLP